MQEKKNQKQTITHTYTHTYCHVLALAHLWCPHPVGCQAAVLACVLSGYSFKLLQTQTQGGWRKTFIPVFRQSVLLNGLSSSIYSAKVSLSDSQKRYVISNQRKKHFSQDLTEAALFASLNNKHSPTHTPSLSSQTHTHTHSLSPVLLCTCRLKRWRWPAGAGSLACCSCTRCT